MIKRSFATLSWKPALVITMLFIGFGIPGILHHEIWLDEAHHWLLARDSKSFSEMVFNSRYEGHPLLWNSLLFILAQFTSDPIAMQVLNLFISSIAIFLLLRFSPFSLLNKLLVVSGYFIFYEYTIISRNYALAFLLMVIVCILNEKKQNRFLLFSFALAMLAQTHLFAAIISIGIFVLSCFEFYENKKQNEQNEFPGFFAVGSLLILCSLILVVIEAIPPKDHFIYTYDTDPLLSFKRIGKGFSVLWKGLFPIPAFGSVDPWNSNLAIAFSKKIAIIPVVIAWLVPAVLLTRKRPILIFFYSTALCITAFIYFSPLIVAARHCGFLFLLLLVALWMTDYFPDATPSQRKFFPAFKRFSEKIAKPLFTLMLLVHGIAAVFMYVTDWNRPFSNGKEVATWLTENTDPAKKIIVNDHFAGPPVSVYFGKKVYYAESNSEGSFCKWNTYPFMISQDVLLQKISDLLDGEQKEPLWLVTNKPLHISQDCKVDIRLVINFSGALVQAENYWVYAISTKWENQKHIW